MKDIHDTKVHWCEYLASGLHLQGLESSCSSVHLAAHQDLGSECLKSKYHEEISNASYKDISLEGTHVEQLESSPVLWHPMGPYSSICNTSTEFTPTEICIRFIGLVYMWNFQVPLTELMQFPSAILFWTLAVNR